jgi:hypothetical protein
MDLDFLYDPVSSKMAWEPWEYGKNGNYKCSYMENYIEKNISIYRKYHKIWENTV